MNRTVEKGKTLLIDGPASVTLVSGKAEAFGYVANATNRVVIREGKRLPFAVEEKATFDISLAEKANVDEAEGNTIPPSWIAACEQLASVEAKPVKAIVLGTVDSGKSSFCTFLTNHLLRQKKKVAVLDGDLGQSDIGPPCTVAFAFVARQTTDLFNLQAKNAIFIGVTSPNGHIDRIKESLASLEKEIQGSNPDFVIINSDGWIETDEAVRYKVQLVETLSPGIVFLVQKKEELAPLEVALGQYRKVMVESPSVICERSGERRKNLRELGYTKYLRNAKVQSFPLGWLKIEGSELFGLSKTRASVRETKRIHDLLGMKPLHFAEQSDRIVVIIGRTRWIDAENLRRLEETLKKKVVVLRKGEEEGLLAGLYNVDRRFLGIGVVQEIDYLRKTLKMLTPVPEDIAIASIGKVKLDKNLKETPMLEDENQSEIKAFSRLF